MDPEGTIQLLTEIVPGAPSLPGAACRRRHELFDPATGRRGPEDHEQDQQRFELAAGLCRTCPVRSACPESLFSRPAKTKIPIAG